MSKFIAIAVICSLFLASQAASLQKDTSATIVVSDLNEYLLQNPELVVVAELERSVESKVAIRYTIGRRISGDRLVGTSSQSNSWSAPQDVTFTLSYPKNGVGAVVTYVQVDVNQSTNVGRGVVVSGGIGQRQITVAIEAKSTTYFQQSSQIYGY